MGTIGVTRKIFIDSRYKARGTDADFTIELPQDCDCTRTSSFFVASCSFANTYQTVTPYNNILYYFVQNVTTGVTFLFCYPVTPASYVADALALQIKAAIDANGLFASSSVTFDGVGHFQIVYANASGLNNQIFFPNFDEIDKFYHSIPNLIDGFVSPFVAFVQGSKRLSVNTLLNMPRSWPTVVSGSPFSTGVVDLSLLREVYLHCSLSQNRTLHVNGSTDAIARIPIDVGFGEMVVYRHLGPTDAISCSDAHFRTIAFQIRDWTGNLVPTGSYIVIELCFLENDPYAM